MQTTGRLRVRAARIRNAADDARLLNQHATAAQENLFSIAVDKNDNIVEVSSHIIARVPPPSDSSQQLSLYLYDQTYPSGRLRAP